jgi:multidrug efflux pump subunit AcrA (membrane-fusion protein)
MEKASRQAERKASLEQLEQLRRSQAEARQALENLRVMYNDGRIRAPSDGIVGPQVAVQGDVIKHGDHPTWVGNTPSCSSRRVRCTRRPSVIGSPLQMALAKAAEQSPRYCRYRCRFLVNFRRHFGRQLVGR